MDGLYQPCGIARLTPVRRRSAGLCARCCRLMVASMAAWWALLLTSAQGGKPMRLHVAPPELRFAHMRGCVQLLVSCVHDHLLDLTPQTPVPSTNIAVVQVEAGGVLVPAAPGHAEVVVSHDGCEARIPVEGAAGPALAVSFALRSVPALTRSGGNAGPLPWLAKQQARLCSFPSGLRSSIQTDTSSSVPRAGG